MQKNDSHFISLKKTRELQTLGLETDERYRPSSLSTNLTGSDSGMIIDNNLKKNLSSPYLSKKILSRGVSAGFVTSCAAYLC